MWSALLVTSLVSAAGLKVRVLELEKPTRVTLEAKQLTCNEQPMREKSVELRQYGQQLEYGETRCDSAVTDVARRSNMKPGCSPAA